MNIRIPYFKDRRGKESLSSLKEIEPSLKAFIPHVHQDDFLERIGDQAS